MSSTTRQKLWIDTDAGTDDAHAILIALAHAQADVIGFSTVYGNTTAAQSAKNVTRVLKLTHRLEIPVHVGVEDSLVGGKGDASYFHGPDGMGGVPDDDPPDYSAIQHDGVQALIKAVQQHKGELEVIALGPLTNIALALRLQPDLGRHIKHCHIMGGNYAGEGNITAGAEFNFYCDPEAAHVVLRELGCPIMLSCWETCMKLGQSWDLYHKSVNTGAPLATFVKRIFQHSVENYYTNTTLYDDARNTNFEPADQVTVAAALHPDMITSCKQRRVKVELHGADTRGLMVVDWRDRHYKDTPTINLVLDLDRQRFSKLMFGCLQ